MKRQYIYSTIWFFLTFLFLASFAPAWAADGNLDPSFITGTGVSKIPIIRNQSDWLNSGQTTNGVSLIFGYFNQISNPNTNGSNVYSFNSLAKLNNTSGLIDTNFHFPINGPDGTGVGDVRFAALTINNSSTCDIIIGGSFSLVAADTTTYYNLARLKNVSGTWVVDTTFPHIFNQGGLVWAFQMIGTYQSGSGYIMLGGYGMKLNPATGGDTAEAYHLIRLGVSGGDYVYDTSYAARFTAGGIVNSIMYRSADSQWPGAAFVFGTFPQPDGSLHWVEVLSSTDLSTPVASLGSNQFDGPIYSMAAFGGSPYQRIFVGSFKNATFGGTTTSLNRIAQVSADLSGLDNTNNFNTNINTLGGANHAVQQIFLEGGQPVIAGNFTSFNGANYGHLVRLLNGSTTGGTVDTAFNYTGTPPVPTSGADDRVFRVYQPTGQPYLQIVGSFHSYNGSTRAGIANLNGANGSVNPAYSGVTPSVTGSAAIGTVYAIGSIYGSDGRNWWNYLVIGGDFTGVNGHFNQNLAFLNQDGSLAVQNGGTVEGGPVRCIRGQDDGSALVAGNFGQILGVGCTAFARLTSSASGVSTDYTFRPVITKADYTVADLRQVDTDDNNPGKFTVMGSFDKIADNSHTMQPRSAFARLNSDGSLDTSFDAQISIPSSSNICVNAGGSLGGGNYGMIGYYLYNGTTDAGFGCVLDQSGNWLKTYMLFDGEVKCGAGISGNRLVFGGKFSNVTSIGGTPVSIPRNHIAAMNMNFTLDSSFAGAGANGPVHALRTQGDNDNGNKLLIGGNFTTYGGAGRNNIARANLDGSVDLSFNPGTGTDNKVQALQWTHWGPNGPTVGKALVGGAFSTYNGVSRPGLAQVFASMGANQSSLNLLLLLGN